MEWLSGLGEGLKAVLKVPLWLLFAIAVIGLAVLYLPALPGFDLTPVRKGFGAWIALAVLAALVCFFVRVITNLSAWLVLLHLERPKPSLKITVGSTQTSTWWSSNTQPDGTQSTQLCFDFFVHNDTGQSIFLKHPRLITPHVGFQDVQPIVFVMAHPGGNEPFRSDFPVQARHNARGKCTVIVTRPLGKAGKQLRVVVGATDQLGFEYRIRATLWPLPAA